MHTWEVLEPFGPEYPKLGPSVAKFRKIPRDKLTPEQRLAYSEAIGVAIRGLQQAALQRELPTIRPNCASRTWHNTADGKIGEAIRTQQRHALLACPGQIRRARTAVEWGRMYADAMAMKRQREEQISCPHISCDGKSTLRPTMPKMRRVKRSQSNATQTV